MQDDIRDAVKAVSLLHGKELGRRKLRCFYSEAKDPSTLEAKSTVSTLSVKLDGHQGYIDDKAIDDFFSQFGEIASVTSSKEDPGFMLVEYYRISDSRRALKAQGMSFLDGVWSVSLASPRKNSAPLLPKENFRSEGLQRDSARSRRDQRRQRSPERSRDDPYATRNYSRSPHEYRESPYPPNVPRYVDDRYGRAPAREDFYESSQSSFRERDERYGRREYVYSSAPYGRGDFDDRSRYYSRSEYPERESRYDRPSGYPETFYRSSEPRYLSSGYRPVDEYEYPETRPSPVSYRNAESRQIRSDYPRNGNEEKPYIPQPYVPQLRTDAYPRY